MAYKFQRGEAILSGALLQEGNIEIESGFEFAMHEETILDTSRNLTVADMSGSGKLEVGSTVQLDGVADEALDVAADSVYFLDSDGFMKSESFADLMTSAVAGDNGLSAASGVLSIELHGNGGIEQTSDALQIKALGVTNAMLAGSIESAKIAELNNFDTADLAEGSNLYFTDERVDDRVASLVVGGDAVSSTYDDAAGSLTLAVQVDDSSIELDSDAIQVKALGITNAMLAGSIESSKIAELSNFDTADLAEGTNLYYLDSRARAAVSVTDNGGDGAMSYDSSTGVISFTGPSAVEVRAHFSGGEGIDLTDGEIGVNVDDESLEIDADHLRVKALGITNAMLEGSIASTKIAELGNFDTADLAEGTNLYFLDSRARAAVSVTDAGGDGSMAYNSTSGVITYTGPSAAEVRAHFSVVESDGDALDSLSYADGVFTFDGLGADEIRAQFSAVDAGGDGSFAYADGVFTYTGPSAAEVRAHLSVVDTNGVDMTLTDGAFSADLILDGSSLEVTSNGLRIASAAAGAGLAWADGVLSVEGSVVTAQTANVALSEGYNYMADLDGAGSSLSMTLPAAPTVGDIVHVKAKDLTNDAVINISRQGSHLIDGEESIVLESPFAAVSLVYVASDDWRIV
jgi:hypothetical protein